MSEVVKAHILDTGLLPHLLPQAYCSGRNGTPAGSREGHVEELRLLRELVTVDKLLIAKHRGLLVAVNETGQQDDHSLAVPAATAGK